jgi:hypothetical protein
MDYPSKLGINIFSGDKNTHKETVAPIPLRIVSINNWILI